MSPISKNSPSHGRACCLCLTTIALLLSGNGVARADRPNSLASVNAVAPSESTPIDSASSDVDGESALQGSTLEIARLTNILPLYERLRSLQAADRKSPINPDSMESLHRGQRIVYLRTQISQYLHTAHLQLSSLLGTLNSGLAELADRQASVSDARARILRRNTTINLFSGGITKIGGYSSALTPASLIPTNVLEVFDGGVQTLLSASSIRQQRAEDRGNKTKPLVLEVFVNDANDKIKVFPDDVWRYLTSSGRKDGKTRRQVLLEHWINSGRLRDSASPKRASNRTRIVAGVVSPMNDLDDMVSMMSDLKSVVSGMEGGLVSLCEKLSESYKYDPPI